MSDSKNTVLTPGQNTYDEKAHSRSKAVDAEFAAEMVRRARRLIEEDRHKDAELYLRQALERVPDHKECQAYIAVCLAGKRKFVSAEKLAKNVIRNNPFDAVAYYALVAWRQLQHLQSQRQTTLLKLDVEWSGETGGPVHLLDHEGTRQPIAFDHADILGMAVKRIRGKLDYVPIGFQLLLPRFTLRQLQEVHETILDRPLNKDSFRRRMLASGLLEATGEREEDVGHRPAELYRFTRYSAI